MEWHPELPGAEEGVRGCQDTPRTRKDPQCVPEWVIRAFLRKNVPGISEVAMDQIVRIIEMDRDINEAGMTFGRILDRVLDKTYSGQTDN